MESLADRIQSNARSDRPVLDKTGLVGSYEIKLTYNPKYLNRLPGSEPDPNDIDIFTAVQELASGISSASPSLTYNQSSAKTHPDEDVFPTSETPAV
jgi:hypothetical protein